jgi:hypothetical protein
MALSRPGVRACRCDAYMSAHLDASVRRAKTLEF